MPSWAEHKASWSDCRRCPLGEQARYHVLGRRVPAGSIRSDLLVLGEAPGAVENAFGQPFVGPAGQVLDEILSRFARLLPEKRGGTLEEGSPLHFETSTLVRPI